MREWFISSELLGLDGMPNTIVGVSQKARRNNWLKRKASGNGRAFEYHISNFHPDIKRQLIKKYVTDSKEATALILLDAPSDSLYSNYDNPFEGIDNVDELSNEEFFRILEQSRPTRAEIEAELEERKAVREAREREEKATLSEQNEDIESDSSNVIELKPNNKDVSYVTYYDITASAGAGRLIEYVPSKRIELSETLRLALNIQVPSRAKLLNMEGDSMHPTLKDKSILAIEELETFKQDGVYVFTFDNTLYVKRLQKSREGIKVISDNPIYDAWFINRDEVDTPIFTIHGRVTGCAQSV